MKLTLVFLALVGCVAAYSVPTPQVQIADSNFLQKQKFLFEILYRVEDPLIFEQYIKYGNSYVIDRSQYTQFNQYMEIFYQAYQQNALLPQGEFFGALVPTHYQQARGLFNLFYYANNYDTFIHVVSWARLHVNEGMFVYALTLAVIHRPDFEGLILPQIYEIFPQLFFNSRLINHAQQFDYDTFNRLIMYEKEYNDVLYSDPQHASQNNYFLTRDWRAYQWWKLMGLDQEFYVEQRYPLRGNIQQFNQNSNWLQAMQGVQMFFIPVDYTRDIGYFNEESQLSYFTEDVGWNAYWYYLNLDYAFFLDGQQFGLQNDRRGEYWIYSVQQILARYYLERLSNGLGEIPEFYWFRQYQNGYDPQLIYYNGVGYSYRQNYFEYVSYINFNVNVFNQIQSFFSRIYNIVQNGYYTTAQGTVVNLRQPQAIQFIGNYLQGNIDVYDRYFLNYWYIQSHILLANVDYNDFEVLPNIFLNFETMLRDPLFYSFYQLFTDVFYQFQHQLGPYTQQELSFPGINIVNVQVSQLQTYFDLVDVDISNLLNDYTTFNDGELVWNRLLLARQQRLNHKPFQIQFTIQSNTVQQGVVRIFIGPRFDEYGSVIPLNVNRENFVQIDSFIYPFVAGQNVFNRSSTEFYSTVEDPTTYTELYHYVRLASEGKYDFPLDISEPHNGFPDRLILPRGSQSGVPYQFYFIVSPYSENYTQFSNFDYTYSSGVGSGTRFVDSRPFGFPFNRPINEYEFFVPNSYFLNVNIYHVNTFQKYFQHNYENYGSFDYSIV